ncbi:helix-turn-helix domain-containing protein [Deinococcus sp.]|uniref:ArsR/SmtB family transcription factor n=1 Tax=Deinococcus sp. TaxID=47478 RepID=UPI0025F17CAD|nr:helix-turn-helix domain-containing protein [Deinococcus sp.]
MAIPGKRVLEVESESATALFRVLSSETRVLILSLLSHNTMNVAELTAALDLPHSTVSLNIKQLVVAGLLQVEYVPGTHGTQKLVSKRYDEVLIRLPGVAVEAAQDSVEIRMPIGNYRHVEATAPCGLASDTRYIGTIDDPRSFFEPDHVFAQILWLGSGLVEYAFVEYGFVEYAFPYNIPFGAHLTRLEFSAEVCSEAPSYDPDWPSDITLWINEVEIGTWTSPADFGGVPARFQPSWWNSDQTTYGLLQTWEIGEQGSSLCGQPFSEVRIGEIDVPGHTHLSLRLGIKPGAVNVGGLKLFGRKFGNHPQDLLMRLHYAFADDQRRARLR